jgi:hypothetical protein
MESPSTQRCGDWRVGSKLQNLGLIEINGVCYGLRLAGWKKVIIAQRPRAIGVINFSDVKFPPERRQLKNGVQIACQSQALAC